MTFNKPNPQSLVVYLSQHQKQLHTIVVVLLSLYLIAFAAKLVWRIIPEPQLSAAHSKPCSGYFFVVRPKWANIAKMQQLNLFGNAAAKPAEPVAEVTDAPETRLNLTLTGVVASSEQEAGTAIIENRGSQAVYGLGEKIEGTNATLQKVYNDRVIIKNGVRNETLMLDGIDYDEANRRREMQARNRPEPEDELEEDIVELSDEALGNRCSTRASRQL